MSWSVSLIGKRDAVITALIDTHEKMTDQLSKEELGAALPHMVELLRQNVGNDNQVFKVEASGHGYKVGDEVKQRQLRFNLDMMYHTIV